MNALRKSIRMALAVYGCWLLMLVFHEAGHVLSAIVSGGSVECVAIPWFGFSETFYSRNPHPLFVSWGGPFGGVTLPLLLLLAVKKSRIHPYVQFLAGFCLIANGAYLGVGWTIRAGDAGDLVLHGAPIWTLILFGAVCCGCGFWLWHRPGNATRQAAGPL